MLTLDPYDTNIDNIIEAIRRLIQNLNKYTELEVNDWFKDIYIYPR